VGGLFFGFELAVGHSIYKGNSEKKMILFSLGDRVTKKIKLRMWEKFVVNLRKAIFENSDELSSMKEQNDWRKGCIIVPW